VWTERAIPSKVLCAAFAAAALCACSEANRSPTDSGPDDGPPGTLTTAQRTRALDAAEAKAGDLRRQGLAGDAFNQALAAWFATRPEFEASGVDETSSVWARFDDGRLLIVPNNRELQRAASPSSSLEGGAADAAAPPETTELPGPVQVRLFHAFGAGFGGQAVIDQVRPWFQRAGYTVAAGNEGDARVETLRKVSGDGFFYFNTHGGKGTARNGRKLFAMWTSSVADTIKDRFPDFKEDLDSLRMVYMAERTGEVDPTTKSDVYETRYAITYLFVEKYMSFGKNSILYFNVCWSGNENPDIDSFVFAAHKKGAGVYVGWTRVVSDVLAYTAFPYFVDRLLGANEYQPENPKQRPFAWPEVLEDMKQKGLTIVPGSQAELVTYPSVLSGRLGGLLAPSIQWVVAYPQDNQLQVSGIFGENPGPDGRVTIDDGSGEIVLQVVDWTPTLIKVNLPRTGPGSSGTVVVAVRGHRSNPRQLIAWRGTMTYTETHLGSLTAQVVMNLNFRIDPAPFRLKPAETPHPNAHVILSADLQATAAFNATGQSNVTRESCTLTHTFSGSRTLSMPTAAEPAILFMATATVDAAKGELDVRPVISTPYTHTMSGCGTHVTNTRWLSIRDDFFELPGRVRIRLDPQLNAIAGRRSVNRFSEVAGSDGPQATTTLEWALIRAAPAYDPDLPR
jgi:hypothetical protein